MSRRAWPRGRGINVRTSEVRSNWVDQTPGLSALSASSNLGLGGTVLPVSHPRLENRKYGRDDALSRAVAPVRPRVELHFASAWLSISAQQEAASSCCHHGPFFCVR